VGESNDSSAPPEWAVEQARVSLQLGHQVADIEKRLIEQGLSPTAAALAITRALEAKVGGGFKPLADADRIQTYHRIASGIVGGICLVVAYAYNEWLSVGRTAGWLVLPLACIWFSGAMSRATGLLPGPLSPTGETTAPLIRWVAWILLFALLGYRIVLLMI
jgi:hypothetical protein